VPREATLIGSIGVLSIGTRGPDGPGEVMISIRGGTECYVAWSPEALPRGTTVLVIESRGTRTVDVSEWSDPIGRPP
jgi:hypothetical protein